ncbi:MAG: hypothetical protein CVU10_11680 [Bacteroidetes bacterium HGW-Bacteroidetes-5]|jgi:hypothetical protein|nr:MAG: hypothetical protein CVU10_11680 [Bacteroidetes bacterium HGW-Bacteroidetes-5]
MILKRSIIYYFVKIFSMKEKILIAIALLISLSSCVSNSDNQKLDLRVIDVAGSIGKGRVVGLSEIASDISYIPLGTNDSSLVGTVRRGLFFEGSLIYVNEVKGHHSSILKIFNTKGEFIRQFNRYGRGPQEYGYISDLQIESSTGNICIRSFDKITEYTSGGQFIRSVNYRTNVNSSSYNFTKFCKLDENTYFLSVSMAKVNDYSVVVVDTTSNYKLTIKYPEAEKKLVSELSRAYSFTDPRIFNFRDSVRVINGLDEYVLSINKNLEIDTAFIIKYGEFKPKSDYNSRTGANSPVIYLYADIFESRDYLFLQFNLGSLAHKPREAKSGSGKKILFPITCAVFNKTNGAFTFADQPAYTQIGFVDDFEGGPAFWPIYISDDEYMISFIDALDFIQHAQTHKVSDKFKKIADGLKETDNPVVVLVKLK